MRSIGIDLAPMVRDGLLRVHADRPTVFGLEMHLVVMLKLVSEFKPRIVIVDPISNFLPVGSEFEIKAMLTRLIDHLKNRQITSLFTSLTAGGSSEASTEFGVSSLMDTWLLLRDIQSGAERNRELHLLKSRGMPHSNQIREFLLTDRGVELRDVYLGPSGTMLTGSARLVQQSKEEAQALVQEQEVEAQQRALDFKRQAVEAQVAALRAGYEIERLNAVKTIAQGGERARVVAGDRVQMAKQRQADAVKKGSMKQRRAGDSR